MINSLSALVIINVSIVFFNLHLDSFSYVLPKQEKGNFCLNFAYTMYVEDTAVGSTIAILQVKAFNEKEEEFFFLAPMRSRGKEWLNESVNIQANETSTVRWKNVIKMAKILVSRLTVFAD